MDTHQNQQRIRHKNGIKPASLLLAVLEYCWVLIVVLNGNSVYHANAEKNYYLLELCVLMTIVLLVAEYGFGPLRIKVRNLLICVGLVLYFLLYFVVMYNKMAASNFLYLFVIGLPCLFLLFAELYRKGCLLKLFYRIGDIVCVLALISLFFWIFGTMLGIVSPNMTTRINWGNFDRIRGYWGLHFEIQRETTFASLIYRNSGIFAEAPMMNLWCDIALGIELLLKPRIHKAKIVILLATIVTTFSTTGFIFIALCFGMRYINTIRKYKVIGKALLILAAVIAVPMVGYWIYSLLVLKSETVSFLMRMSDYLGGLKMWLDYPIFGGGYGNLSVMLKYIYSPNGVVGFSNSVTALPAMGGIWMTLPFYYAHIGSLFPRYTNSKQISMFCLCLFYLFCTTAFFARYLAVVMVAFGLAVMLESRYAQQSQM